MLVFGTISVVSFIIYNAAQRRRKLAPIFIRKSLAKNYNARTIPPFGIYIKESEKDNAALLEHEMVHWRQYQKMGLFNFYSTYWRQLKEHGYDQMPMEQDARGNEDEYCRENYTQCVRNGWARTIYNPVFRDRNL